MHVHKWRKWHCKWNHSFWVGSHTLVSVKCCCFVQKPSLIPKKHCERVTQFWTSPSKEEEEERPCNNFLVWYFHSLAKLSLFEFMQEFQETLLMAAARVRSVGMVRKMIQCGANVNHTNKVTGDWTPCQMFAWCLKLQVHYCGGLRMHDTVLWCA